MSSHGESATSYPKGLLAGRDHAVKYLEDSGDFELGSGPSLVALDQGPAKSFTTSTAQKEIAAMFFDQKGVMGGVGLQGSKLSRIKK